MSFLRQLARQPQRVWLRRALFQVHLWTGIGIGLYVLMISVTGSLLVYRVELVRAFSAKPDLAAASGTALTVHELKAAAKRAYPDYEIADVVRSRRRNLPAEVTLERGTQKKQR